MVSAIGESFDIPTAFYYLQNYGIIQFPALSSSDDVNGPSSVYLIKCRGSMNFHKLPQVYDLVKQLVRDGSSCDLVRSTLKRIRSDEEKAKEFPEWAIALSYSLSAMTSAIMLFHGTWRDALMSGLLGMIPGALRLVAVQYDVLWVSGLVYLSHLFFLVDKTDLLHVVVVVRNSSMFPYFGCSDGSGAPLLLQYPYSVCSCNHTSGLCCYSSCR